MFLSLSVCPKQEILYFCQYWKVDIQSTPAALKTTKGMYDISWAKAFWDARNCSPLSKIVNKSSLYVAAAEVPFRNESSCPQMDIHYLEDIQIFVQLTSLPAVIL